MKEALLKLGQALRSAAIRKNPCTFWKTAGFQVNTSIGETGLQFLKGGFQWIAADGGAPLKTMILSVSSDPISLLPKRSDWLEQNNGR